MKVNTLLNGNEGLELFPPTRLKVLLQNVPEEEMLRLIKVPDVETIPFSTIERVDIPTFY